MSGKILGLVDCQTFLFLPLRDSRIVDKFFLNKADEENLRIAYFAMLVLLLRENCCAETFFTMIKLKVRAAAF